MENFSAPECFGKTPAAGKEKMCRKCQYQESCRYYRSTEAAMTAHSGQTSYEMTGAWMYDIADFDHIPGEEPPSAGGGHQRRGGTGKLTPDLAALGEVLRFLLTLDDYTMAILSEVIVPDSENPGGGRTMAELARLHRCSRQAMHRKTLAAVRRHPELAGVMQLALRKLNRSRSHFRTGKEFPGAC